MEAGATRAIPHESPDTVHFVNFQDNLVPDRITVERGGNPNQDNQDILQGEVKATIPDYLDNKPYCLHPPGTNPMIRAQKTPTGRPPTTRGIPREVLSGDSVFSAGDFPQAAALSASQAHPRRL